MGIALANPEGRGRQVGNQNQTVVTTWRVPCTYTKKDSDCRVLDVCPAGHLGLLYVPLYHSGA